MVLQTSPYTKALAITTSDTVNLRPFLATGVTFSDAIYIGGAGTLTVVWQDDTTSQFTCVAGQVLPVKVKRVNTTGTAATLLLSLYY